MPDLSHAVEDHYYVQLVQLLAGTGFTVLAADTGRILTVKGKIMSGF